MLILLKNNKYSYVIINLCYLFIRRWVELKFSQNLDVFSLMYFHPFIIIKRSNYGKLYNRKFTNVFIFKIHIMLIKL